MPPLGTEDCGGAYIQLSEMTIVGLEMRYVGPQNRGFSVILIEEEWKRREWVAVAAIITHQLRRREGRAPPPPTSGDWRWRPL